MTQSVKLLVTLALALTSLAGSLTEAHGQSDQGRPGESREAIELARLVFSVSAFDAIMAQAGKVGTQVVKAGLEGTLRRQLTETEAHQLQGLFTRLMRETVPKAVWEELYADLIARHFANDEIRELAGFYRTPLGAKAIRLSGVFVTEGAAAGERLMQSRQRMFGERFASELAREMPELKAELERAERR